MLERIKQSVKDQRTVYDKSSKEYKAKVAQCDKAQETYIQAFKTYEDAVKAQRDALSEGTTGKKMQKLESRVSSQAVVLTDAYNEYNQSVNAALESQSVHIELIKRLLHECELLEVERLESIKMAIDLYVTCEEDSGIGRDGMKRALNSINVAQDVKLFAFKNKSVDDFFGFRRFEKLVLKSTVGISTDSSFDTSSSCSK
jgi:hypothetical protein